MMQHQLTLSGMEQIFFIPLSLLKVGFFEKVMAKFSNLSNRHACEPKIVPELLFPVNVVNTV